MSPSAAVPDMSGALQVAQASWAVRGTGWPWAARRVAGGPHARMTATTATTAPTTAASPQSACINQSARALRAAPGACATHKPRARCVSIRPEARAKTKAARRARPCASAPESKPPVKVASRTKIAKTPTSARPKHAPRVNASSLPSLQGKCARPACATAPPTPRSAWPAPIAPQAQRKTRAALRQSRCATPRARLLVASAS